MTFQVVAETHNFTRAAMTLGYSQSGVTMQIKALERELGTMLFERCRFSRRVELTDEGRLTLDYARRLLTLADETKAAVRASA
ncbi:MAG TPA: LysR family transcriptional regulator [Paludibaculum sp.]